MAPPSKRYETPCKGRCGGFVRNDNKSGYCRRCVKASPEFRANVSAAAKRKYENPEQRAKTGRAVRRANQVDPTIRARKSAAMRTRAATPEWQERNRQNCTERRLWEKGLAGRTPESLKRQGETYSRRHGIAAWCPAEYVELARELRRAGVSVDETKRMVFEQEAHDLADLRRGKENC